MFQSYQLTPLNLRPPQRPSRRLHAVFQQKIDACVEELQDEIEIVDGTNEVARELLMTVDAVLCHGLIRNDKSYWRYVREFLPVREQRLMEAEYAPVGGSRRMSLAWLKDSFNRSSLHFQLLAFLGARSLTRRFYIESACLRNYGVFELIVINIGKLDNIQFAFDRSSRLHGSVPLAYEAPSSATMSLESSLAGSAISPPPMPATAVVAISSSSTRSSAFRRHRNGRPIEHIREEDAAADEEQTRTPDVVPPPLTEEHERLISCTRDQDMILNDLARQRRSRRLNGYVMDEASQHEGNGDSFAGGGRISSQRQLHDDAKNHAEPAEQRLDDVLQKTISQVKLEQFDGEAKSFTSILNEEARQNSWHGSGAVNGDHSEMKSVEDEEDEAVEGAITLHSGEVLRFAMDVFADVDLCEKFHRLFHVYDGSPSVENGRLLLVTDRNLYLLTQSLADNLTGLAIPTGFGAADPTIPSTQLLVEYTIHATLPLTNIAYIELSHGGLIVVFYSAQGSCFNVKDKERSDRIVGISTGDQSLGACIFKTIVNASTSVGTTPPAIYDGIAPFELTLRRFIRDLPPSDVLLMSIAFWNQTPLSLKDESSGDASYMMWREVTRGWFTGNVTEWKQSFFIISDSKLYIFSDSSCRLGEKVLDLRCNSDGTPSVQVCDTIPHAAELPNVMAIRGPDYHYEVSFPSPSKQNNWIHKLQNTTVQPCVPPLNSAIVLFTKSHMLICQIGENCFVDGFIRSLVEHELKSLKSCLVYSVDKRQILLIHTGEHFEWLFPRTEAEAIRIRNYLESLKLPIFEMPNFPPDESLVPLIDAQAAQFPNLWAVKAFYTGCDAIGLDS